MEVTATDTPENLLTVNDLGAEISQVARSTFRRYGWWIATEDVQQSLWEWVLTPGKGGGKKAIERFLTVANDPDRRDEGLTRIRLALRAQASKVGEREKADQSGYDVSDVYWFSPAKVAELLPDALDPDYDGGASPSVSENVGGSAGSRLPEEKSDRLVAVLDVRRVISRWSPADRADLTELGDRFGYAVARVLDELGGEHPRRALINNERAARVAAAQYGGEK